MVLNRFIPFSFPGLPEIGCVFGIKAGGSIVPLAGQAESAEAAGKARRELLEACGLKQWSELRQVHEDGIVFEPEATDLENILDFPAADAQATRQKGLALCIKTADCQPLFLAHQSGAVMGLHVGWRGNRLHFPQRGARAFCEHYGLNPAEVLAVRGPSLGPGAAEFVNYEREWPAEFSPWFKLARKTMDLWSLTRAQLIKAGLLPENIFNLDLCTFSLTDLFFSHRRREAGRQASIIWIR